MYFKKFDYLASIYGFTYDDGMRFQTNCGGFLSILLFLIGLVTIGDMGSTLFERSSPSLFGSNQKFYSPPPVTFDSRFNVAFRMTYGPYNLYTNLDKIKIKFYKSTVYKSNLANTTTEEIPMSNCDRSKFPYQQEYFDQFNLNESLCPVMDGRTMKGAFLSEYYIYFQAKFYLCINDPITGTSTDRDGIVCQSPLQIQDFLRLNNVRAHIFYSDCNYDMTDYSYPNISYMNNYNIDLYYNTVRETHLFISIII